jgi:hypothetical protein
MVFRGECLVRMGRLEDAIEMFDRIPQNDPVALPAGLNRAQTALVLGDIGRARAALADVKRLQAHRRTRNTSAPPAWPSADADRQAPFPRCGRARRCPASGPLLHPRRRAFGVRHHGAAIIAQHVRANPPVSRLEGILRSSCVMRAACPPKSRRREWAAPPGPASQGCFRWLSAPQSRRRFAPVRAQRTLR